MNIVLMGFMGTGKSVVGKLLAEKLGWAFLDTDALIEKETGFTVAQIFTAKGEDAFRDLESKTIGLVSLMDNAVIATGGGAPLRPGNVHDLEKNGMTVCLEASPETILSRLKEGADSRPLLSGGDAGARVRDLLASRRGAYARARHRVSTDGLSPQQVADRVLALLPR